MIEQHTPYGMHVTIALPYEDAVARTRDALAAQGFGVLTEIDVRETLKRKLDEEIPPYVILGACNPPLAHRAISAEPEIGLLLPCNVVVRATDDPGRCAVAAIDPVPQLGLTGRADLAPLAQEVRDRLRRALESLAGRA